MSFILLVLLSSPLQAENVEDELQIHLSLSKNKVWQREQVIIKLEVISKDKLARLDSANFKLEGFTLVPLLQESVEVNEKLHLRQSWQVFSQFSGKKVIELSDIKYRPSRGRATILKLPKKILSVIALPIYVPPTMPVGKIIISNNSKIGWNLLTNRLYQWDITIFAKHVSPETLPAISRLLRSTKEIQILPFKKIKKEMNLADLSYEISYQVPFKARSLGRLHLPKIGIQFFNPDSGKIEQVVLDKPLVLVLNYFVLMFIAVLIVLIIAFLGWKFFIFFKQRRSRKKKINAALLQLKQAKNYQQIRVALNNFALANNWQENSTLEAFAQNVTKNITKSFAKNVQQNSKADGQFSKVIEQLQNQQFSHDRQDEIGELAKAIFKRLSSI
jgi:cbb3-type cytochrome oxidase subunit 3